MLKLLKPSRTHQRRTARRKRRRFAIEQLESRQLLAVNFINPAGGLWSEPTNWQGGQVPTASDEVVINLAGDQTITVNIATAAALSITSSEKLAITGTLNTPSISGPGTIELRGGSLRNANVAANTAIIGTSLGGSMTSVIANGNLDLSQVSNANVSVINGLTSNGTIYLGNEAGSTYGRVTFASFSVPSGTLSGNATIVFGGHTANNLVNGSGLDGAAGTLTIGSTVTIRGKSGSISNSSSSGNIVNQGTISADVAGGAITLNAGAFTNVGTINVLGSTLNLNSSHTLAGLGTINRTGGTINLGGKLDLQNSTWTLDAVTGSWNLNGGSVWNGTLNQTAGSQLNYTNNGGSLVAMTVNGLMDLSQTSNPQVSVNGGLVLNGTMLLGNTTGSNYGRVTFASFSVPSGTLSGNATIIFGGHTASNLVNGSSLDGAAGTLTIGSTVTIRGKSGSISNSSSSGNIVNQGTISADVAGGAITLNAGAFTNVGTINVLGSTLNLNSSHTLAGLGTINRTGGTINLGGKLDLQNSTWTLDAVTGSWNLNGGSVWNGTLNQTAGSQLNYTNNGGSLVAMTVNGLMDLSQTSSPQVSVNGGLVLNGTMLLGNTTGSNYGRVTFASFSVPSGTLSGNATIIFGGHTASNLVNGSSLDGAAGTLTIGSTVTIRGKSGSISNSSSSGNIVNQGTISADVAGGAITLNAGAFTNVGTINVLGSTLNLNSSHTLPGLGTINRTGGTINLGGKLDLQNSTWTLDAVTGSWNLNGGSVWNGTLNQTAGSQLNYTNNGGSLVAMTVNGLMDLSQTSNPQVSVNGGLVLNGTMLLGNTTGSNYGRVTFASFSVPSGALSGNATIIFGGHTASNLVNGSSLDGAAGTFTIGSTVTIRGKSGSISNNSSSGSIVNQGTISADVAGGAITLNAGAFTNVGTINVLGSTLSLNSSHTLPGLGTINRTGGTINLGGKLDLQNSTWTLDAVTGSWNLNGGSVWNGTLNQTAGSQLNYTNNGGSLVAMTVNGLMDLSQTSNPQVSVNGGLVLNGTMLLGNATGSTYGRVTFASFSVPSGALSGNATIVFGGHTASNLVNGSGLDGAAGTFTIGSTVTIRGKSGSISNNSSSGSIVNQGTISADVAGGAITLNAGAFTNVGTINVLGSTLNLNSSHTLSGLGKINRTSGTINLGGKLDLQNSTWTLDSVTGSWNLNGGSVWNGTLNQTAGSQLNYTNNGGSLVAMTVNGLMDLSQTSSPQVSVNGGLVLNGTMLLGNATGSTYGRVTFASFSVPSGALSGNATIIFGGHTASNLVNGSGLDGAAGTFTIGSTVTIRGKSGSISNNSSSGSIVNQGTISADVAGGAITVSGGSFSSSGAISILNGASLSTTSSLLLNATASLNQAASSSLTVAGSLTSAATNPNIFRTQGKVVISGGNVSSPRLLEVMGQYVAANASGFLPNNFSMGSLNLASSTYVKLINQSDNVPGIANEALYVNSVIIPAGSTIDLNGLKLVTRALQQGGTVLNGSIEVIPDSGALTLGIPTPGALSQAGQLDEWSFFSFPGRQATIIVNPGASGTPAPVAPQVNWVRVEVLDAANNVLATLSNPTQGGIVTLNNVALIAGGIYRIRISASPGHLASTGNYMITAWDSTPNVRDMELNRTVSGVIATPYGQDQWNFSAAAGMQVQFDLVNTSTSGLSYTLTGPNGFSAFTDIAGDSNLITLPFAGVYRLTARGLTGAQGSYAFVMKQTTVIDVALGSIYNGMFAGTNDARVFRIDVPANQVLTLNVNDATMTDRVEMYASFGAPPTREVFEYRYSQVGNSQRILIPGATAGAWYVLVYAASVPNASSITFSAQGANAKITSALPERAGNALPVHMTIQGAGFANGTTVELIAPNGTTTYAPTSFTIDSYTQITADFPAALPAGSYSVRVTRSGNVDTLSGALQITEGGQAIWETQLIMPPVLGRRTPATLYVEYANTGDLAMPAPLIILQSTDADDSDKPILSLDESRRTQDFWTSVGAVMPPGTSHSILVLASGKQPGVLNPGERVRIPVYYMGLLFPWANDSLIEMELRYWTVEDTTTIDWPNRQESLRPPTLGTEQWSAVFGNLVADIPTTGDYVRMLNENAEYLGRLGQNVVSVDDLWNFEVQQAYGMSVVPTLDTVTDAAMPTPGVSLDFSRSFANSIQSRYDTGPLGQGWYSPWQTRLFTESVGKIVRVVGDGGSGRTFSQDARNGSYFSGTGDSSTLVAVSGGYELRAINGSVTKFRADGRIEFVRDTNNNRVTAAYHADGRLLSLTHTNGASLTLAYNAAGRVSSVTDSAGRVTTYGYDATNTYLTSVTTSDGKVTNYTYQTSGSQQVKHSMLSIERGGTTQFFTYDNRGRLDTTYLTGNAQLVDYTYSNTGLISVADTLGSTSLHFDHNGLLAKVTDPLGYITTNQFDANLRLRKTVSPTGESQSFTWCACGSVTSVTNEQGYTTSFAYDNPFKRMTSFTDARGQKTSYTYDANGNLLTTVYPNGSVERLSNYSANGLAQVSTNRRGQALSYTYNAAGQVMRQTFADNTFITFAYDTRGNLTTVTDGPEVTTYTYNYATDGDRLKRITYPNSRYLDYLYDAFGRRIRMTDQDNFQTRYEYDAAGRLYRLRDASDTVLVTYLYDASGRLSRIDKGNGTFTTYTYDAAGQLLSLKNWRNPTELNSKFDYTYDSRGRRISMVTLDGTWTYGYDGSGQLMRAVFVSLNTSVIPNQDLTYMYDPAGNRIRTIENGVTKEYVTNGLNQYTSVGGVAQVNDADGNLTFDGVNTFVYDQQSRLVRVTGPQGVTEYEYDAFGNRVAKVENGIRTEYLNDPSGLTSVTAEFGDDGIRTVTYAHGAGLVSQRFTGDWSYFDFDALGSTAGITATTGSYETRYAFDPFGNTILSSGTIRNSYRFIGQYGSTVESHGLSYMRARYYNHIAGRFTAIDPIRLLGEDYNLYRYVGNTPTMLVDPSGLKCWPEFSTRSWDESYSLAERAYANSFIERHIAGTYGKWLPGVQDRLMVVKRRQGLGPDNNPLTSWSSWRNFIIRHAQVYGESIWWVVTCGEVGTDPFRPRDGSPGDDEKSNAVGGVDPNEKRVGIGYGPQAFVANNTTIPYRIDFENYEDATAPAQVVTIIDPLSSNFDWSSFRLTEVGFGDTVITVPVNTQYYQTTRTMTYNSKTFSVLIELGLRAATGEVFALFQSLDPDTQLPPDVLTGFLPPEDGSGRGKGYISYTIKPKANLTTGTEIRNIALISFDGQQTISTDQVDPLDPTKGIDLNKQARVTIDAVAPTSQIVLPAQSPLAFDVSWSATDDAGGSGVGVFDVLVSDNGGPYKVWLSATTDTTASYVGLAGKTYRFQVYARDNAGNRQLVPASATTITPNAAPVMVGQSFTIHENTVAPLGTMSATDADAWQTLAYSIASGNTNNAFAINPVTGLITIASPTSIDFELQPSYALTVRATDNGMPAAFVDVQVNVNLVDLPELLGVVIGDGSAQRSLVKQVVLTFDGPVTLDSGALAMTSRSTNAVIPTQATQTTNGSGQTILTLTFSGAYTRGTGALLDGYYQLVIDGTKIHRGSQLLDANRDGVGGDVRTLGSTEADKFFALFGDTDGDGVVGITEFGLFRSAFGKSSSDVAYNQLFDYDLDGVVGIADFGQFRNRFGKPKLGF